MPLSLRSTLSSLACIMLPTLLGAQYANCQTFSTTGSMAVPLICQTSIPLQNGTILIAGGVDASGATTTAEIYNPNPGAQSFAPTGS